MYEDFIPERLALLRIQAGVSAREMSLSLGQADNYINSIENRKTLPSMASFFYICEYFRMTPEEFFDTGNKYPGIIREVCENLKLLDLESLKHVAGLVGAMANAARK